MQPTLSTATKRSTLLMLIAKQLNREPCTFIVSPPDLCHQPIVHSILGWEEAVGGAHLDVYSQHWAKALRALQPHQPFPVDAAL